MLNSKNDGGSDISRRAALAFPAFAATAPVFAQGLGLLAAGPALAQGGREYVGGKPPADAKSSVSDLAYQVAYQRAFEAILWAIPAAAIYGFRRGGVSIGMKDNDIMACSAVASPKIEAITPNSSTPYISAFTDLKRGPVVVEIPKAGSEGTLYGQVVDAWQMTIADVGPSGVDQGNGGKLLFTPPGYSQEIPNGYIHIPSPNYRITFAFRSIIMAGKSMADAYAYSKKLRMYYLSEAGNPPTQVFFDAMAPQYERIPTLPFYDERAFEEIHAIVSYEPVNSYDKLMMGMLKSLGIEWGKPFNPSETARRAMRQAPIDAWSYMQEQYDNPLNSMLYWPDRHYISLLQPDANKTFSFVYDDQLDFMARAFAYTWCTFMPKLVTATPATQYMMAMADKGGKPLEAGKIYKIDVPAKMPVKQFWAVTLYDRATFSLIYSDSERTTLSSYDVDKMRKNSDGSISIFVGPSAPKGLESNWIPSSGKRPLPAVRFYGPTEEFNSKSFKLPDFELVG